MYELKEGVTFFGFPGLSIAEDESKPTLDATTANAILHSLQELACGFVPSSREPTDVQQERFLTFAQVLAKWTNGLDIRPSILP